ncbi:MAG: hypothetical protein KAJ19_05610 [Gammaproteobacteria bacterium]|nr:hypothetical protein [Gammaproteobacteria bacterium]
MTLIDTHELGIEKIVDLHGTTVTLIAPDSTEHENVKCLFNAVDHGFNLSMVDGDPMVSKTNVYISLKELSSKGIVLNKDKWQVRGKKGKYAEEQTFLAEAPKKDEYLPGLVLFLSIINPDAQDWGNADI